MKASLLVFGLLSAVGTAQAQHISGEIITGAHGTGSSHGSIVSSSSSYSDEYEADVDSASDSYADDSSNENVSQGDKVKAAWALHNVTDDALDLAEDYKDNPGIGNTTAGTYLSELAADTKPIKSAVARLAGLLDRNASRSELDKELKIIADRYADIRSGHQKASIQLSIQGKVSEGYQIRTAYTKIRSRWVYLQGLLD